MNAPRGGGKASTTPGAKSNNSSSNSNNKNRNNRQRQRRNKQHRKANPRKSRGPPQSPQIKVMFRSIGNSEGYGTAEGIAGVVRTIVAKANERLTGSTDKKMLLDEESLCKLIENDKKATQAMLEWKKRVQDEEPKDDEQQPQGESADNAAEIDNVVSGMKELDLKEKEGKILARPLYMVPAKKTRRRGDKPGNAYLILTTPPIDLSPPPVPEVPAEAKTEDANQTEEKGVLEIPPVPPKVDYTRQTNQRQLALVRAVEVMREIAVEDAKGERVWAGCQVEESRNGKSWRPPQRRDNREGTIEESPGFKAFMEMAAKEKEALQARPKPTPGGGLSALSAGTSNLPGSTTGENGKPIATLVAHIQNKREQEKLQKKNKRKAKTAKKKGDASTVGGGETPANGKAEGNNAKKKPRRRKKASAVKKANPAP